jgi:cytochrome c oxidase subunit 2
MWKLQHAGGQREIDQLHVPLGRNIRLVMTSEDVIHSFFVPEFRAKMDVLPGRYTFFWFRATELGTFHLLCAQFCGTEHSRMRGEVIVMQQGDYARWLDAQTATKSPTALGAQLFVNHGCVACHQSEDATRAPPLEGVYGSQVLLIDGRTVLADENYLRRHIQDPGVQVVAGYAPIMPSFRSSLSEDELLALVQYIKSLGQDAPQPGGNRLLDGEVK